MSASHNLSPRRRPAQRLRAEMLEPRQMLSGVPAQALDLGVVDFLELSDQEPVQGELWYRLEAAGDGLLTADLPEAAAATEIELTLYTEDEGGDLHEEASGSLRVDLESAVSGGQYALRVAATGPAPISDGLDVRLTNLVLPTDDGVIVYGTGGPDVFEFEPGPPTVVTIHGVAYHFDFSSLEEASFAFFGGQGADTALLTGSGENEVVTLEPNSGEVVGPGYRLGVVDMPEIAFEGGGGQDSAKLDGTDGSDAANLWPGTVELVGTDYGLLATDVASVQIDARDGDDQITSSGGGDAETVELRPDYVKIDGTDRLIEAWNFETAAMLAGGSNDQVAFYDSAGNDELTVSAGTVSLAGSLESGAEFSLKGYDFGAVTVDATAGGNDTATFQGTNQDETVELWPDFVELTATRSSVQARGFESVAVFSGGCTSGPCGDLAIFHDSVGDDRLEASPDVAKLSGPGYSLAVHEFATVEAYAEAGGTDRVELSDSPGNDNFVGTPTYARMYGDGFSVETRYFEQMYGYAREGDVDVAKLYDSTGDDTFHSTPAVSSLSGFSEQTGRPFIVQVESFRGLHTYATAGGEDAADLRDSPGDDNFVGTPTYGAMYGQGYYNRAKFFETVQGYSEGGGVDVAKFYDGAGNDNFVATPLFGLLYGDGYSSRVEGFAGVHAYATYAGVDVARLYDSPQDDNFYANPEHGALYRPGYYYNRAKFFEGVHAYATAGGRDVARLFDSPGDDKLHATPESAALWGEGYYNRAKFFEEVHAEAAEGGDDEADLYGSASLDLLEAEENWVRLSNAAIDFLHEAAAFDYVKATAGTGGGTKRVPPPSELDFRLDLEGTWL